MERDEFARLYARNSHLPLSDLLRRGVVVLPCSCGEEWCRGWRASTRDALPHLIKLGRISKEEAEMAITWADHHTG